MYSAASPQRNRYHKYNVPNQQSGRLSLLLLLNLIMKETLLNAAGRGQKKNNKKVRSRTHAGQFVNVINKYRAHAKGSCRIAQQRAGRGLMHYSKHFFLCPLSFSSFIFIYARALDTKNGKEEEEEEKTKEGAMTSAAGWLLPSSSSSLCCCRLYCLATSSARLRNQ